MIRDSGFFNALNVAMLRFHVIIVTSTHGLNQPTNNNNNNKNKVATMTTPSRRLRRTREVSTSTDELLSGYDLYDIQGDAKAALDVFSASQNEEGGKPTVASDYNLMLLRQLATREDGFINRLEEFEAKVNEKKDDQMLSARKRKRNDFIFSYNKALVHLASGQTEKCVAICNDKLETMISSKQVPSGETIPVAYRMGLLLVESLLGLSIGRNSGLDHNRLGCAPASSIIEWLEHLDTEHDPQLKFLLALYKSRVDLAELDDSGKLVDSKIRSARKELKTAMEVFQHKLRPSFGAETASVVSSANSEENLSMTQSNHDQQQPPPSSLVLQKYNQSALSLKANLEQLKGNTKKSLILCSEAQGAAKDDGSYNSVHSNNLAVVYETNDKRHLALHALTKALRSQPTDDSTHFHRDGTARPDVTLAILHNSAICALQAKNFLSAYECMAACVSRSGVFRSRPRCWLRMAEALLGLFAELKRQKTAKFATVEFDGYVQNCRKEYQLRVNSHCSLCWNTVSQVES